MRAAYGWRDYAQLIITSLKGSPMAGDLFMAKPTTNATFDLDGQPVYVQPGDLARAGHPVLSSHGDLFEPLKVKFDVAQPEPEKGKGKDSGDDDDSKKAESTAPASSTRADQRGARTRSS